MDQAGRDNYQYPQSTPLDYKVEHPSVGPAQRTTANALRIMVSPSRKMLSKISLKSLQGTLPTQYEQQYLLGVRGLVVIETFLWVFFQTFVPVVVAGSADTNGKLYQEIIRKTLSVLFWNEYLLYGAVIFLSARSIAIPFLRNPTKERVARTVLCRGITLWFPVAVALAIVKLAFSQTGLKYIYEFKTRTSNKSMAVPYGIPNTFAYFNSVFDLFWTTHNYDIQAGSTAFPSQTLWIINAIYMQSYTVYLTMVIIPFTRNKWRVQGAIFFILAAWWCDSWAWYTITGLIIADMVVNMNFKSKAQQGIPMAIPLSLFKRADGTPRRMPVWVPAGFLMAGGLTMQYLWTAWRPDLRSVEFKYHSNPYYTAGINVQYETRHIQARDDEYLILLGFFILLESSDLMQRLFNNKFLTYLGSRSLSFFLIQSTMIYLVGIKVFAQLHHSDGVTFSGSVIVTLITCLAVVVPMAEVFYRLVELPSKILAHRFYDVLTS